MKSHAVSKSVLLNQQRGSKLVSISSGVVRYLNKIPVHFVAFSCFRHRQFSGTPKARDTFLTLLERTCRLNDFNILGYFVMPDHVHVLISEPREVPLSLALQILRQCFSKTRPESEVWESRYYDFNVKTEDKRAEKLHSIHQNPVRRGLVLQAADWPWSSQNHLDPNTPGPVHLTHPRF